MSDADAFTLTVLLIIAFACGVWAGVCADDDAKAIRTEAVERGFAEWVPDKEGNTTFKWKEVAK